MALRFEPDTSHAAWWAARDEPWQQLCTIGPTGYAGYVQVLHPLDEEDDRTSTLDDVEGNLDDRVFATLLGVLARHTTAPDDCLVAWWEGAGNADDPEVMPAEALAGPRVRLPAAGPARRYLLFRGTLAEVAARDVGMPQRGAWLRPQAPAAVWPADRAWFLALDTDSTWTGIGGPQELVEELLRDPRFEARVVPCDGGILDPRGDVS